MDHYIKMTKLSQHCNSIELINMVKMSVLAFGIIAKSLNKSGGKFALGSVHLSDFRLYINAVHNNNNNKTMHSWHAIKLKCFRPSIIYQTFLMLSQVQGIWATASLLSVPEQSESSQGFSPFISVLRARADEYADALRSRQLGRVTGGLNGRQGPP